MPVVISIENLSKSYRLGQIGTGTLTNDLKVLWAKLRGKPNPLLKIGQLDYGNRDGDNIWALHDICVTVKQGEILGVIGRNGAGKSTLLKILSRVTAPSNGLVKVKGRIASLLEVGTGFHPELTGRENIFLNGAILGMTKTEIRRKFDEIVSFAEVEKFIDTPVKRYSSGMYVRLAFAVAAHLEPEILLVDEVLAVGDANFQKKCLGKMEEIGGQGRTILFVSHSMPMILRLCNRVLLLGNGLLLADGDSNAVVKEYLKSKTGSFSEKRWIRPEDAPGDSVARLKSIRVLNKNHESTEIIDILEDFYVEVEYWNFEDKLRPTAIIHLINSDGVTLFASNDFNNKEWAETPRRYGVVRSTCCIPGNFLAEGSIYILVAVGTYNPNIVHALERDAVVFQVVDRSEGKGVRGEYSGGNWPGVIRPYLKWNVDYSGEGEQDGETK